MVEHPLRSGIRCSDVRCNKLGKPIYTAVDPARWPRSLMPPSTQVMIALLKTFSWQELKHHPWRNAAAVVAVMLGVALAFSVHLINASALSEFSQAVRSVNGQPDLELRAVQGSFDEALYARVANHPQVQIASPVLEVATYGTRTAGDAAQRQPLRIVGVDVLAIASIAPALIPVPSENTAMQRQPVLGLRTRT